MIKIVHNSISVFKSEEPPPISEAPRYALEIRFHFVDGSRETFIQRDAAAAERTRNQINAQPNFYHQPRIVVADDYSKSVFVCSHINRIDLIFGDPALARIPPDHLDLVELSEAEFRQLVPRGDST